MPTIVSELKKLTIFNQLKIHKQLAFFLKRAFLRANDI